MYKMQCIEVVSIKTSQHPLYTEHIPLIKQKIVSHYKLHYSIAYILLVQEYNFIYKTFPDSCHHLRKL